MQWYFISTSTSRLQNGINKSRDLPFRPRGMFTYNLADEGEEIHFRRSNYGSFHTDLVYESDEVTQLHSLVFRGDRFVTKTDTKRCKWFVYTTFENVDQLALNLPRNLTEASLEAGSQGIRVRALLICNPHNLLRRGYSKQY